MRERCGLLVVVGAHLLEAVLEPLDLAVVGGAGQGEGEGEGEGECEGEGEGWGWGEG